MIITELKRDKKHLTRVFLSNQEEILLDNDICIEYALAPNLELENETVKRLIQESDYKRAKSRALWYLDRMDYTERALYEKLLSAGFNAKASANALASLCHLGLVDDRRYAERFAQRCADNNVSKREAVHKMLQKGVPLDLAKEVLQEIETDEQAQIAALLEKKYRYKLSQENGTQKVFASLARKGFSFGAIKAALKKYDQELEFSEEY